MKPRGQTFVAALVLVVVVSGGVVTGRAGVSADGTVPRATVVSGAWFCPHGGGKDWSAALYVANPGVDAVMVRASGLAGSKPRELGTFEVAPGSSTVIEAPAEELGSATVLEYFGGWVGAGWVNRAGGGEIGVAAEPCAPEASRRWTLPDGDTSKGEDAYAIVSNPFSNDAVFSVVALTDGEAPTALTDFTDLVLAGGRSVAVKLDGFALGEPAIAARIDVSIGRVAAASLGITSKFGIRSSIGWPGPPPGSTILPGGGDSGGSVLVIADPSNTPSRFSATMLTGKGLEVPGQLQDRAQDGATATAYQLTTGDPSAIWVRSQGNDPGVMAARRTRGTTQDLGSTAGAPEPATAWVVLPATGSAPRTPSVYLTNPGEKPVDVELTTLRPTGASDRVRTSVPPGRTVAAPKGLYGEGPDAPVLAVSSDGEFVPAGASYSQGANGVAGYAVSVGIRIPDAWIPS